MTLMFLQEALKKRLEDLFQKYPLQSDSPLHVFIRNIPPKQYEYEEGFFPFCKITVGDGEDSIDQTTVQVILVFGTQNNADDLTGYSDICHLVEMVRLDLLENPLIENRFQINLPLKWTLLEDEPDTYPQYFGAMFFEVEYPTIQSPNRFI